MRGTEKGTIIEPGCCLLLGLGVLLYLKLGRGEKMTLLRMTVSLWPEERAALRELAMQERRDPRDQAAVIIREVLTRRGLLMEVSNPGKQEKFNGGEVTCVQ